MFKLMVKKIMTLLRSITLLNLTYAKVLCRIYLFGKKMCVKVCPPILGEILCKQVRDSISVL